jgi:hypothetical protein
MANKDLLYIEDAKKRKLFYRFTPAAFASNFVPLLVVLHGEETADAPHFEYKMWNVLTPIDSFGYEGRGTCWLGEEEEFFVKDLLQKLIRHIAEEYECEDHIYLYGSSMGGYGAILHGILCQANAVYAHIPRIRLPGTDAIDCAYAFSDVVPKENDLSSFLNAIDDFPIFYLCDDTGSAQNTDESSVENDAVYFANACKKHAITVDLDHCPKLEGDEEQRLKVLLDMFERVAP